jgi:solute carrier family 35, member E3
VTQSLARTVTFLTAMHMVMTALALRVFAKLGYFERKHVARGEVAKFGVLNSASIALLNLSLGFNSVGFYQMTKLSIIPVTVMIQMAHFNKKFSHRVKGSLAILLVGVGASTVTDVQLNALGCALGALSVITTAIGQILTGSLQTKLGVSSTQLLCASAPWMAVTLLILAPPVDDALNGGNILDARYDARTLATAAVSCLLAILVNFATFAVIGKCSAVTYQVVGHLKTMLVLAFGFVVVGDPIVWSNVLGLAVALAGMVLYAKAEMLDRAAAASPQHPSTKSSIGDEESNSK